MMQLTRAAFPPLAPSRLVRPSTEETAMPFHEKRHIHGHVFTCSACGAAVPSCHLGFIWNAGLTGVEPGIRVCDPCAQAAQGKQGE
jgi:hypothetical protein